MARSRLRSWPGLVLLCLTPTLASASQLPSISESKFPTHIRLVGSSGGVGDDARGRFSIEVVDLSGAPLYNARIELQFFDAPDLAVCTDQLDPGVLVQCPNKTVRKITDWMGKLSLTILGGIRSAPGTGTRSPSAKLYCNDYLMSTLSVAAFDLDGVGGLGAADLTAWLTDFASGLPCGRSDYDGNGTLGATDLAEWLTAFASGASLESCTATCP